MSTSRYIPLRGHHLGNLTHFAFMHKSEVGDMGYSKQLEAHVESIYREIIEGSAGIITIEGEDDICKAQLADLCKKCRANDGLGREISGPFERALMRFHGYLTDEAIRAIYGFELNARIEHETVFSRVREVGEHMNVALPGLFHPVVLMSYPEDRQTLIKIFPVTAAVIQSPAYQDIIAWFVDEIPSLGKAVKGRFHHLGREGEAKALVSEYHLLERYPGIARDAQTMVMK